MKVILLNEYLFGDMKVMYFIDNETKNVELMLVPIDTQIVNWDEKKQSVDSLVQLKIVGDTYLGGYAGGVTMRQGESTTLLKYKEQKFNSMEEKDQIITTLKDDRGYEVKHYLTWYKNSKSLNTFTKFYNKSSDIVTLEMISSFSIGGITPFTTGDAYHTLKAYRLRSVWSMEGRLETNTIEDFQLEPSWGGHAVRSERFGQVGSMAVNHYFPYLAIEDTQNDLFWGVQLAHNASWQMELYRKDDGLSISGGLADREFGHWIKQIAVGEQFITPNAILSVCKGGGIDAFLQDQNESVLYISKDYYVLFQEDELKDCQSLFETTDFILLKK
ncbi:hypothetical protein CG709_13000 [Lachnotalea glycerini]|nr:hypothetical protein CG709_13000 [Lachnotalea glycerini]